MAIDPKPYNLDDDVREFFQFTLKGKLYQFRQMTTEEIEKFQKLEGQKDILDYLCSFCTPVDEKGPPFAEVAKQMIAPHWKNFINMVTVEMTGQSPKANGSN